MSAEQGIHRLVKRYRNRKLYDTESKNYVSLKSLAQLVREGYEIRVVENETGEDLTAKTLAKIIAAEGHPEEHETTPRGLHELIRRGGRMVGATVGQLEQRLESAVGASLEKLGPIREVKIQVDRLHQRITEMEGRLSEMEQHLDQASNS